MSRFDPARAVLIAADSVAQLRRSDVFRVLDANYSHRKAVAAYITENRPDLASEVQECLSELAAA